eukprot:12605-Heterococcus_DN1.PRE.1
MPAAAAPVSSSINNYSSNPYSTNNNSKSNSNTSSAGGHVLNAAATAATPLSPAEVKAKRLALFDGFTTPALAAASNAGKAAVKRSYSSSSSSS